MQFFSVIDTRLTVVVILLISSQLVYSQSNVAAAISVSEYGDQVSTLAQNLFTGLQSPDQATRQQAAATFSQQLGVASANVLLGYQQSGEDATTAGTQVDAAVRTAIEGAQSGSGVQVNVEEIAGIASKAISDGVTALPTGELSSVANKVAGDIVNPVFQTFVQLFTSTSTSTSTSGDGNAVSSVSTSVSSSSSSAPASAVSTSFSSSSSSSSASSSISGGKPSIDQLSSSLESIASSAVSSPVTVSSLVNGFVVQFVQAIGQYIGQILVSGDINAEQDAQDIPQVIENNLETVFQAADFDTDLEDVTEEIEKKLLDAFTDAQQSGSNLTAILNEASQGILDVIVNRLNTESGGNTIVSASQTISGGGSSGASASASSSVTISGGGSIIGGASIEEQQKLFADQFVEVVGQIQGTPTSVQNVQAFLNVILQGVLNATALVISDDTTKQTETISGFFRAGWEGVQSQLGGSFSDLNIDEIMDEIQSKTTAALQDVDFAQTTVDISNLAQTLGEELFNILGIQIGTVVSGFDISGVSFSASGSTSSTGSTASISTTTTSTNTTTPSAATGSFSISSSSSSTFTTGTLDDLQEELNDQMLAIIQEIINTPSYENIDLLINVISGGVMNATTLVLQDDAESQAKAIAGLFSGALKEISDKIGGEFANLDIDEIEKQIEEDSLQVFGNYTFGAGGTLDLSPIAQRITDIVFNIIGPKLSVVIRGFQFTISGVVSNTVVEELRSGLLENFTVSFGALANEPKASDIDSIIDVILKVILQVAQTSDTDDVEQRSTLVLNLLNQTLTGALSSVGGEFESVDVPTITDEIYKLTFNIFTEYEEGSSDIDKILDNVESNITKVVTDEIVAAVPSIQAVAGSLEVAPSPEAPTDEETTEEAPPLPSPEPVPTPTPAPTPAPTPTPTPTSTPTPTPAPIPTPTPAPTPAPAPTPTPAPSTTTTTDFSVSPEGLSVVDFKVSVGQLAETGLANVTNAANIQDAVNSFASQFGINLANVIVYLYQNGIGDVNETSNEIGNAIRDALTASVSVNVAFQDLDIDSIVSQIETDVQSSLQGLENGDDATQAVENIANQVVNIIFNAVFAVASQAGMGSQPIQASFIFNATGSSIEDLRERLTRETQEAFSQINAQTPSSNNEAIISQLSVNMANILGNVLLTVLQAGSDEVDAISEANNITEIVESVLTQVVQEFDLADLNITTIISNINITLVEAITAAQQPDAEVNSILQTAASSIFSSIVTALGNALGLAISGTVTISTNSTTTETFSGVPQPATSGGLSPADFSDQLEALFNFTFQIISEDASRGAVEEAVGNLVTQLSQLIANVTVNIVSDVNMDVSDKAKAIAGSFETALTPAISGLQGELSGLDVENITSNIENIAFTVFSDISELSGTGGETVTINLTPLVQELVNTVVQIIITQLTETIPGFQFNITIGADSDTSTTETSTITTTTTTGSGSTTLVAGLSTGPIPEAYDVCTCYTEAEFDARVMEVVSKMLGDVNAATTP